ncbi:transport and Golgi organization protein 1 isoform X2 [Diorhabda sublineata]|uniref:transport and Golgi organization protein 1 isoform X2 n=1 Tax=Diorhabda sublineata TaxID=1163346 RepID=UPI0024E08BF2|nr:transport and Golgi organization protein 1 isoform X2 [Diorhabda sublineata]
MCSFKLIYFIIFLLNAYKTNCLISDKRLCVNEDCTEPISLGKTLLRYNSPEHSILSFKVNEIVKIFSKEAGSRLDLWGVEINGNRGYIPKNMVREYKVLAKPNKIVDTELLEKSEEPVEKLLGEKVDPDKVKQPYEVVDGTTIPIDSIIPTSTDSPVLSTAINSLNKEKLSSNDNEKEAVQDKQTPEVKARVETEDSSLPPIKNITEETKDSSAQSIFSTLTKWVEKDELVDDEDNEDDDVEVEDEIEEYNDIPVRSNEIDIKSAIKDERITEDINIVKEIETDLKKSEVSSKNTLEPKKEDIKKLDVENELKVPITDKPNNNGMDDTKEETKEAISNTLNIVEESREETETTTLSSIDSKGAPPISSTEYVSTDPIGVIFPLAAKEENLESVDNKPEDISTGNQDGSLEMKSSMDVTLSLSTETTESVSSKEESEKPQNEEMIYQPNEANFQKVRDNLFGRHLNGLEEKSIDVESNAGENIAAPNSSAEIKAIEEPSVSFESKKVETESDQVISQADSKPSETQPPDSWYGNVNTNIDTLEIEEKIEILQDDLPINDIPSDVEINSLKNSEGILPNHLLGDNQDEGVLIDETMLNVDNGGILDSLFSFFGKEATTNMPDADSPPSTPIANVDKSLHEKEQHLVNTISDSTGNSSVLDKLMMILNSDVLLYLLTTAASCIIFLFIYLLIDRNSREAPLIKKINDLEKELLISLKEKDILQDSASDVSKIPTEELDLLKRKLEETEILKGNLEMRILSLEQEVETKQELEEQIESLERELETSTEVGMELNRIISEMLNPSNGGEKLKENVEQLQRQLSEQKWIINDITKSLDDKEKENAELQVQLDESRKKSIELQKKLDEIVDRILKIEKERDQQQKSLQEEISMYQQKYNDEIMKEEVLNTEIQILKTQLADAKRKAELKIKEYQSLKDSLNGIKSIKNDKEALQSLLNTATLKAELEQLKSENENYLIQLKQEQDAKVAFEKKCQAVTEENNSLLNKYQESDKLKLEATMKLEVLNNYFKKREEELQGEILKYKSIWDAKEGEATSTTERIKLMAEEIENYKSQNETLKQEIVSQEIDLKSQISILEKKVHENWVTSRQMERKLEDAKQEAAQLRNRLTLRERAVNDERLQNRLQSPIDQNGELTLSPPPPIESPTSPLLFGGRDHITKSPPLPGLPPFLPPPPGAPFMPPPLHGMPFMPPPPAMFPGDHRPPPLGRMSSPPPLNSRYSPDTSAFSPYERNTPSPPYDSEYGASPPPISGYSPYSSRDDRRDYKRSIHVSNGRNNKGSLMSSGSDNSNDSLDKVSFV